MFDVAIATSGLQTPDFEYTVSMIQMVLYYANVSIWQGEPQGIRYLTPQISCVLSANRENHAEEFLKTPCTHLCFIDADMGFEPEVLHILASRKVPYVGVNYSMKKKANPEFTAMRLDGKCRLWTGEDSTGLEDANFTGFGLALIERRVIEAIPRPRFLIGYNTAVNVYTTEDAPFCHKVRDAGFPVYVDHDASKLVWHMGRKAYRWQDVPKPVEKEELPQSESAA